MENKIENIDQCCNGSHCGGFKGCIDRMFDENNIDCVECLKDASDAIEWANKYEI